MDVHKKDIAVALMSGGVGSFLEWQVANEPSAVKRLAQQLQHAGGGSVQCVDEAGSCGYALLRQHREQGLACDVVAPSMIPIRPGERIKTGRRDARKLAELARAGPLTVVHRPTEDEEAVRDLCRGRDDAQLDLMRTRRWIRQRPCLVAGAPVVAGQAGVRARRGADHVRGLPAFARAGRGSPALARVAPGGDRPRYRCTIGTRVPNSRCQTAVPRTGHGRAARLRKEQPADIRMARRRSRDLVRRHRFTNTTATLA